MTLVVHTSTVLCMPSSVTQSVGCSCRPFGKAPSPAALELQTTRSVHLLLKRHLSPECSLVCVRLDSPLLVGLPNGDLAEANELKLGVAWSAFDRSPLALNRWNRQLHRETQLDPNRWPYQEWMSFGEN